MITVLIKCLCEVAGVDIWRFITSLDKMLQRYSGFDYLLMCTRLIPAVSLSDVLGLEKIKAGLTLRPNFFPSCEADNLFSKSGQTSKVTVHMNAWLKNQIQSQLYWHDGQTRENQREPSVVFSTLNNRTSQSLRSTRSLSLLSILINLLITTALRRSTQVCGVNAARRTERKRGKNEWQFRKRRTMKAADVCTFA